MDFYKHTECSQYYANHVSSKVGAIVTTIMLSALLILFIVGRSTLDYSALRIPEKEEVARVVAMKIRTVSEEQVQAVVKTPPMQKKRIFHKQVSPLSNKKTVQQKKPVVEQSTVDTLPSNMKEESVQESSVENNIQENSSATQEEYVGASTQQEENDSTEVEKAIASLLQAIEKKKVYPQIARRAGYEGTVQIQVTLNAEGIITGYSLYKSSGYAVLDNAILNVVKKMSGKKITNTSLKGTMEAIIPIRYALNS